MTRGTTTALLNDSNLIELLIVPTTDRGDIKTPHGGKKAITPATGRRYGAPERRRARRAGCSTRRPHGGLLIAR